MKASLFTTGSVAFALLCLSPGWITAQNCPNGLSLIQDTLLCQPGPLPAQQLIAGYTGTEPLVSVSWSPAERFTDPNSVQTTYNAAQTAQVQITVQSLGPNLITNGDFSQGDTGFTSDYTPGNSMSNLGPLADKGQYLVSNNPSATQSQFAPCTDHTSQGGNMMVVNGFDEPSDVWCQVVTVDPETDYQFQSWVVSVVSQNPARLQFSINDQLIGSPFTATSTLCNWQSFDALWNSGTATSAEICVENVNLSAAGNDFALDDISFRPICTATDSVTVNVVDGGTAAFTVPTELCRLDQTFVLDDFLDSSALTSGTWQLDGQPATEFNSGQLTAGTHQLVYEITAGTCQAGQTRSFTIQAPQEAGTFPADPLTLCLGETLQSDRLATSLSDNQPGGSWLPLGSFPAARIDPATGRLDLDGATAGTYDFGYVLSDNGICPADTARGSFTLHPEITIEMADEFIIDCFEPRTTILPTLRPIATYTAEWYSTGSPNTPLGQGISFTADMAGAYRVAVTDPATGCAAEDFTSVVSNIAEISLSVSADSLDCDKTTADGVLRVDAVSGGEGPYVFSFNGRGFTRDSVYTDLPPNRGYDLITQDINGCTDTVRYDFFDPADWDLELATVGNPIVNFGESVKLVVNTTLPADRIETLTWEPLPPNCENCLEATVRPDSITKYLVTVRSEYGCVRTDSLSVLIFIGKLVYTPTAFSPNGDGVNDTFTLLGGQGVDDIELLEVYSRWGELLYQGVGLDPSNLSQGWDGKIRGEPAPPGAYLYRAKVRLFDQRLFEFEGAINLLR